MKKTLNNNGWGLRAELLAILLFLFCIVVAVIGLNRLGFLGYNSDPLIDNNSVIEFDPTVLERRLVEGAKKYVTSYYSDGLYDSIIVKYSTLRNYSYISKLVDGNNEECSGYVIINSIEGNLIYSPYVKCKSYKTNGYNSSNDW